jgi:APA family basic amino acid/polyamine antiporter
VKSKGGVPWVALLVQLAIVVVLLLFALFDQVLKYVQFSIQLCSFLAVVGVMVLRFTQPNLPRPYRTWGYPVTPLIFLAISLWMMVFLVKGSPMESLYGLGTLLLGLIIYFVSPKTRRS